MTEHTHTKEEYQIIADQSLDKLCKMMKEMANVPREELGKRQPGERGKYETSRASIA